MTTMRLTNINIELEDGVASLGLFGDLGDDGMRPPHVQITLPIEANGDVADVRAKAIDGALKLVDAIRASLESAR
ncbi:MAG: hypothetical protein AAF401_04630 [Pseudomonadota bacterium]